jgi:hypothetical protein
MELPGFSAWSATLKQQFSPPQDAALVNRSSPIANESVLPL